MTDQATIIARSLHVRGVLAEAEAESLLRSCRALLGASTCSVQLNMSRVTGMDQRGIDVLLAIQDQVHANDCQFILVSPSTAVLRALDVARCRNQFHIEPERESVALPPMQLIDAAHELLPLPAHFDDDTRMESSSVRLRANLASDILRHPVTVTSVRQMRYLQKQSSKWWMPWKK